MAETGSYIPPQSPIAIQPGDTGFEMVGKAYNRWMWTFPDWKNKKSKIINPNTNWGLNSKAMSPEEIKKKMKNLYLSENEESIEGGLSSGRDLKDIAIMYTYDDNTDSLDKDELSRMISHLEDQLLMGMEVEMEHTNDELIAREIAMDHLAEDPNYYTKLKKIEEKMQNVISFDDFISESYLFEGDKVEQTTPQPLPAPDDDIKVYVVKKVRDQDKVINSAIRVKGPRGTKDYAVTVDTAVYTGPIIPTKFWKSDKGEYYVMMTNKDQTQRIDLSDVKKLISAYNSGLSYKTVPVYKDTWVGSVKLGTITFKKVTDFSSVK